MTEHRDDSQMSRFEREGAMRFRARDAVLAVAITALLCVLFSGGSVRDAAAEIDPGIGRDDRRGVGEPTGWIADRLPFAEAQAELTAGLSPDDELGEGGFAAAAAGAAAAGRRVPPVTPEAFDPAAVGAAARRRSSSSRRCSSPATRSRRRSTRSSPGGWRPTGSR